MNNLYQKIQQIETLQNSADKATSTFKKRIKLDCIEHCAECCRYNDIEATSTEFLPLAWHAYKLGLLEDFINKLDNYNETRCIFSVSENNKWGCKVYPVRGMICRLFGFAAVLDKHHNKSWSVCKTLKDKCHSEVLKANEYLQKHNNIPVISDFYSRLSEIDFYLSQERYPINIAIRNALEIVFNHFYYSKQ